MTREDFRNLYLVAGEGGGDLVSREENRSGALHSAITMRIRNIRGCLHETRHCHHPETRRGSHAARAALVLLAGEQSVTKVAFPSFFPTLFSGKWRKRPRIERLRRAQVLALTRARVINKRARQQTNKFQRNGT